MIGDLKNSIIFLHGLSGSGKGEIHRKLAEQYSSHGYDTIYVSSGALFRAALSNPTIAEQLRRGYYLDTLGAIISGIETAFDHFIRQWVKSDGKATLILDGLIRREAFVNKDGVLIPSQLEQISACMNNVIKRLLSTDENFARFFPEYGIQGSENEELLSSVVKQTLKDATHVVADVLPEDAEAQIIRRADKEITSIKTQLRERFMDKQFDADKLQKIEDNIFMLEAILHGGIRKEDDGLVYTPRTEWNNHMDKDMYLLAASEVKQIRETIATTLGLDTSTPLTASLEIIGVFTELRDDDVSPIGRKTRINSYVKKEERDGEYWFEPGFAIKALCVDLGFQFTPDGSFHSETRNCIVVANGQSRGIGLEQFQAECKLMATQLYTETELRREVIFEGKEGNGVNREQEF